MSKQVNAAGRGKWAAIVLAAFLAIGSGVATTPAMAQSGRPILVPLPEVQTTYIPELRAYVVPYQFRNDHFTRNATIRAGTLALRVVRTSNGGVTLKRNGNSFRFRINHDYILEVDGDRVRSVDDLQEKLQQAGPNVDLGIFDHDQGTFGQYRTQP